MATVTLRRWRSLIPAAHPQWFLDDLGVAGSLMCVQEAPVWEGTHLSRCPLKGGKAGSPRL